MTSRAISLSTHGVIEVLAAPLLMAAPFFLDFGPTAGAASVALGTVLMALAISTATESRAIPVSAHASFDYLVGALALITGITLGAFGDGPAATAFLVAFGAAHLALTASTRYSARGA